MPTVISVNISSGGIPKLPVNKCELKTDGFVGDDRNHDKHRSPERAVSLIDAEILDQLVKEGYPVTAGAVGENLTVQNLELQTLHVGDRLLFDGGVCIELVEERQPCYVLDPLGETLKKDIVGRCGYLARVIQEGTIEKGASISVKRFGS